MKSSSRRSIAARVAGLLILLGSPLLARAQQAGDNVIQFGFFSIDTLDKSTPLHTDLQPSLLGSLVGIQPSFDSPGTAATVSSSDTLAFTTSHFFTDNIAIKLEGGLPAVFDLSGRGTVMPTGITGNLIQVDLGDPAINPIASAKQWSPALIAQYYFFGPKAVVRPFLGVGFTYTWFTEVSTSQGFQDSLNNNFGRVLALAAGKPGPTHVTSDASPSFAAAYSAGLAFRLSDHWGVSGGIGYSTLKTNAKIEIKAADDTVLSTSTTKIALNPLVYSLLFNYTFKL